MRVGVCVGVGRRVRVGVGVYVWVGVLVGVGEGTGVGGSPSTMKRPEIFQINPTNICTSYSPGDHTSALGSQSV